MPSRRIPPDRIIAAPITKTLQLFEHPDQRQALAPRLARVRLQQLVQIRGHDPSFGSGWTLRS
jgi:hypothetical protein